MTYRSSIARLADDAPVPDHDSWPARKLPPGFVEHPRKGPGYVCQTPSARDAVCAAMKAQAKRTARSMIKERARDYALRPRELDAIEEGFSVLHPQLLVPSLSAIRLTPYRIHGGEIPAINLRAAMLYARWNRAIASRNARRAP